MLETAGGAPAEETAAAAGALSRLRPRSAPEVVDASVQLVKQAFRPLLLLAAVNAIPALVLAPVMRQFISTPAAGMLPSARSVAGIFGMMAVWMCLSSVGSGAMVRAASEAVMGRVPDAGAALRLALARAGALIVAHLAAYFRAFLLLIASVLVLGIVMGIVFAAAQRVKPGDTVFGAVTIVGALGAFAAVLAILTRYAVMTPVIMVEGLGARAGLARSAELTAGSRWRLFALLLALFGTTAGASLASAQMLKLIVRSEQLAAALNSVLWMPVTAFSACVFTLLYYDLRIRREGYDIELLAGRLTTPTPPTA